jgi:hypothetical protein
MDITQFLPYLAQVPLVVLFAWYNERINHQAAEERKVSDAAHRAERKEFVDALRENTRALQENMQAVERMLQEFRHMK